MNFIEQLYIQDLKDAAISGPKHDKENATYLGQKYGQETDAVSRNIIAMREHMEVTGE